MIYSSTRKSPRRYLDGDDTRLRIAGFLMLFAAVVIVTKLFYIMVMQHGFYEALASDSQDIYSKLVPKRGQIFAIDSRTGQEYPLAMNHDVYVMYADTRAIKSDEEAMFVADKLAELFSYSDERKQEVFLDLNKRTRAYEPIEQKLDEETYKKIKAFDLKGINFVRRPTRYYPEGVLAASVLGFLGKSSSGQDIGRYGVEGYWQDTLAGTGGFVEGAKSARGNNLLTLADNTIEEAKDGADIVLTIDRNLQYQACELLRKAKDEHEASSASLIIMDPKTGAVRAMCSLPDFDPNIYNEVKDPNAFNNTNIFTPYEPGSIFKPITMSSAIDAGALSPETTFVDTGSRAGLCLKPIQNAANKSYGLQTMAGVLQNSINTGVVFAAEKLGKEKFKQYLANFGFGIAEGIETDTEVTGTIDSLSLHKNNKFDCYTGTAAFGQGITVTPLQMITAFSAIVNGGMLVKPYIVAEVRYADKRVEKTKTKEIRRVLGERAALLTRGMLISVVDKGQAKRAQVPGYYIGGKTGTAQISGSGGYTENYNHSFIGFGPGDDPKFTMLIKFEKPKEKYADSTAAPLFAEIAPFVLKYYQIPKER